MTTPKTYDARGGWTSASNALADSYCPGRHLAQRAMPEGGESVYAESGRKVHAALAKLETGDNHANRPLREALTLEERETYDACIVLQNRLIRQYFGETIPPDYQQMREQRYWTQFTAGDQTLQHSGAADLVCKAGKRLLIVDYKTLRGEVAASPRNPQLRDLACLAAGALAPIDEVAVAIIQPSVEMEPKLTVYAKTDLETASRQMYARVAASNNPQSKRVPGEEQCKYCRAKSRCLPYQQWAGQVTPPAMLTLLDVPVAEWTGKTCAAAAAALGPCQKLLDEIKQELKSRLEKDPKSVPGWELKPGALRETITNPQGVFERFVALGGKTENFMPCVDVAKGRLREAINLLTGAKGAKLDAAIKTLCDGYVKESRTAPSLKRSETVPEITP